MDLSATATAIRLGDRRALARAITLIESDRADHRAQALALLQALGQDRQALRIGLSGTPGVGKSTFIEAFGLHLAGLGQRIAVLAVDPSSTRSGGSILGDKTRMDLLARHPLAYIRPSPSRAQLGGIARRTRETVLLCEAAGFDTVLIETVGVGQSETLVQAVCDVFVLLLAPAGGDELQGVKRGIMEAADLALVNKADGDLALAAARTRADYQGALTLLRRRPEDPPGFPQVALVSALARTGLAETWAAIDRLATFRRAHGHWDRRRRDQAAQAFRAQIEAALLARLETPEARALLAHHAAMVAAGQALPETAAAQALVALNLALPA